MIGHVAPQAQKPLTDTSEASAATFITVYGGGFASAKPGTLKKQILAKHNYDPFQLTLEKRGYRASLLMLCPNRTTKENKWNIVHNLIVIEATSDKG